MKWDELLTLVMNEGYTATTNNETDKEVCESLPCQECDGVRRYVGLHNPDTYAYRAFAICKACNHAEEF